MKKLSLIALTLLFIGGCATTRKASEQKRVPPLEKACVQSCDIMSRCSSSGGVKYSEHELAVCKVQCLETEPVLRQAVLACSFKVLASTCDPILMHSCVQSVYSQLRSQQE